MQIFVKTLAGRTSTHAVEATTSVADLKQAVAAAEGFDVKLLFNSTSLSEELTLEQCGVQDLSTVYVTADLLGGGKKRKKKTYTTPKRIKHKHKKVKLATLKYYKVDANNKVERLRRVCPNEMCGPGVFMANHHNRCYCGKCQLTYVMKSD